MRSVWRPCTLIVLLAAACGGAEDLRAPEGLGTDSAELGTGGPLDSPLTDPQLPSSSAPVDSAGPAAALEVIHDYYGAIQSKDFPRAYRYWGSGGEASNQTAEQFAAGFAETESVVVQTGLPGGIDAGAGQRYIEIPAAVRANTARGASQCFRGTYVLRRSEVDGATPVQRSWRIASAELKQESPERCDAGVALGAASVDTVAALVGAFGRQLASVSLLAPADVVSREMRAQYSSFVTPALLDTWLEQPAEAPGRRVSSPWPARIDVLEVRPQDDGRWTVSGDLVHLTSEALFRGGAASREPLRIRVARDGGALRITSYEVR
jgi:hypothetical protein